MVFSVSFFYLLGQSISILTISWKYSLLINCIIILLFYFDLNSLALLLGWVSSIVLTEMEIGKFSFSMQSTTQQLYVMFHFIEIVGFATVTLFIAVFDQFILPWFLTIVAHAIYVFILYKLNVYLERIKLLHESINYYFAYGIVLLGTDLFFILYALAFRDPLPFFYVGIIAGLTLFGSLFFIRHNHSVMSIGNTLITATA